MIQNDLPSEFKSHPAFYFIDPFGPTPVPFRLVGEIMKNPKAEIFLNLDADGINRIFCAGDDAKAESNLNSIFGDDLDWPREFSSAKTNEERGRRSLKIYKENLKKAGVKYVFAFEMRGKSDRLDYFLLFATHHPLGLEKMKEAMMRIAGNNSFKFSDARVGQHELFSSDDVAYFADQLHRDFEGTKCTYQELNDYALNETRFVNPKKILERLEVESKIDVESLSGVTRRRGTFPEEKIKIITFKPYVKNLFD